MTEVPSRAGLRLPTLVLWAGCAVAVAGLGACATPDAAPLRPEAKLSPVELALQVRLDVAAMVLGMRRAHGYD